MILQHIVLTNDTYTSKYTTIVQLNKIFYDNIFCINFSKKLDLYAVNAFLTSTSWSNYMSILNTKIDTSCISLLINTHSNNINYINIYFESWISGLESVIPFYNLITISNGINFLIIIINYLAKLVEFNNLDQLPILVNTHLTLNNTYNNLFFNFNSSFKIVFSDSSITFIQHKNTNSSSAMITTDSVSSNSPLHNTNNISKSNINENLNKTKTKIKNKYDLSFEPNVNKPFNHYNYYYQKSIDNNYNYSYTPSTKIYYPEPFIASPTFVHNDIWFLHIIVYHYWLWFFFIFIIIFFFLTASFTSRWCAMRNKPRRETRGSSRSKCGDLITGLIPAVWASTIVVHESIDSTDWDDGVGTIEMTMAIRAYQWGWEYWYPRSLHLYPSIHRHEPTLFGHNSFNYNYESQIRKKYINEYMSIKSDNILLNTSKLLNTFNDSYSIQKLKCSVSDNSTCRLKYHNYTRPRHKIFLEGDSLAPINSNNSVDFNYIIDVFNKSYMNSALTSQSPFNFYSTMNLFKKQIDFIDYKSLSKMQKNDKYLFYFNKNLILSKNTHLSFYKYVANTFFNNSNIQHSNVEYGSIALSGNKYNFYKNMKFNKFLFPYFTLFSPTLLNQHTSNPELFLEKTKNILKHITNSYVGIKRTPTFVNKYTYRAEHLVNDKYSLKHKYDAPNIYNINNRRNVKTKYILPDKYLNTKLLTYKNIFQLPDFNQIGAAFDEEYSFLNLIDYYWDQLEYNYSKEYKFIDIIENPLILYDSIRFNYLSSEFTYNNFFFLKNTQIKQLYSSKWNINYIYLNNYLNSYNLHKYINNYDNEVYSIFDVNNSLFSNINTNNFTSNLNLYTKLNEYFKEYYNFFKAYYNWYEYTESYLHPRLFSNTTAGIHNSTKLMNIKQLLNKTNIIFYKNKFTYNNLKILPVKNLMWYKSNNTHFYNFNFKDSKEFTLLQSKWRCILFNYRKIEISKPRNLIITPLGKYSKPTYMVIYNNINKNLHKNLTYNNFNTLYTKIFASKKNITPLSFNNYRLEYIINYKNNLHFSKKNNNIFLYPYWKLKALKMLLFQFKVLIPNKDSYNVTLIKNFYSGKIKIIKSNITTTNFTTNFNKNSNRNLLTAKNYSGGLFNYVYKFNDLYLKANFTSASYANYLTHNQVLNTKIIKEISVNFKYILKTNIINDASYKKLYNFISNYTFLSDWNIISTSNLLNLKYYIYTINNYKNYTNLNSLRDHYNTDLPWTLTYNNIDLSNIITMPNLIEFYIIHSKYYDYVLNYTTRNELCSNCINYKLFYRCLNSGLPPKTKNKIMYHCMQYIPIRYRLTLLGIIKTPYTAKLCHNVNIIDRLCLNKEYNMLVNFRYLFLAYRSYILIVKYDTWLSLQLSNLTSKFCFKLKAIKFKNIYFNQYHVLLSRRNKAWLITINHLYTFILNNKHLFNIIPLIKVKNSIFNWSNDFYCLPASLAYKNFYANYLRYSNFYIHSSTKLLRKKLNKIIYYYLNRAPIKYKLVLIESIITNFNSKLYYNIDDITHLYLIKEYNMCINLNDLHKLYWPYMIITIHDTGVGMQINNIASKFYSSVKYIKFKYIKFKYIKFIPTINEITNSYNFYYILPISNKITTMFMNIKFLKIINVIYNNRYVYNLQYKTYNKTLNNYVRYKLFYCSLIHEFINTQLDAITLSWMQYNPAESVRYLTSIKLIRITTYNPRPINFCCSIEKIQYLCLNKDYNILFKIHQLNQFSKRHMLLATRFLWISIKLSKFMRMFFFYFDSIRFNSINFNYCNTPSYLINRFLWTYAYRAAKITLNNTNLFNNINVENLTSLILFYNQDNHRVLNYFIQKKFDHNYLNYKFFYCCLGYGLIPKNNNNIVYYYQHNLIKFKLVLINSLIASNTIKLYCNLYKLNHLLFTKEYNIFINCNYLYKWYKSYILSTRYSVWLNVQINNLTHNYCFKLKSIKFNNINLENNITTISIPIINEVLNISNIGAKAFISNKITPIFINNIYFLKNFYTKMYNKYYLNELQYIIDTELNNNNLNYKLFYMCLNTELINTKINKIIAHWIHYNPINSKYNSNKIDLYRAVLDKVNPKFYFNIAQIKYLCLTEEYNIFFNDKQLTHFNKPYIIFILQNSLLGTQVNNFIIEVFFKLKLITFKNINIIPMKYKSSLLPKTNLIIPNNILNLKLASRADILDLCYMFNTVIHEVYYDIGLNYKNFYHYLNLGLLQKKTNKIVYYYYMSTIKYGWGLNFLLTRAGNFFNIKPYNNINKFNNICLNDKYNISIKITQLNNFYKSIMLIVLTNTIQSFMINKFMLTYRVKLKSITINNVNVKNQKIEIYTKHKIMQIPDFLYKSLPLKKLNLHNINLHNINLHNINLHNINLHNINLHNINLHNINLHNINLHNTNLHNTNLHRPNYRPSLYRINTHYINLHYRNLNHNLNHNLNRNLNRNLNHINLNHINLNHINLNHINLNHINLNHINLNHVDLTHLDLNYICRSRMYIKYLNVNVYGIDLDDINLNNINLNNINLNNNNLNNNNLNNNNLNSINLNSINLNSINLNNINLNSINLNSINLNSINLNNINLIFYSQNLTNPYIPIKRGFNNLYKSITQGVTAIPVGVRMHFVTTSKDIIHSWAIPSAGIKIDCIPGFCSHRIICFWSAGMFWGQCMEICGRYHHWMPILIYFLHRDMFILWCQHFMFYKNELDFLRRYDKSLLSPYSASKFNKNSWINDYIIN